MSLNRLDPTADLSDSATRGQLNETLDVMAQALRRLKAQGAETTTTETSARATSPDRSQVAAAVTRATNQQLTTAVSTAIQFTATETDTGGLVDLAANNTRITFTLSGLWLVSGLVVYAANSTGNRGASCSVFDSGGAAKTDWQTNVLTATNANTCYVNAGGLVTVVPGDYMELYGIQRSGGNLNVVQARLSAALVQAT